VEERVLEAGAIAEIAANSELPTASGQKGTSIGLSKCQLRVKSRGNRATDPASFLR
jgi:hypothetical protein